MEQEIASKCDANKIEDEAQHSMPTSISSNIHETKNKCTRMFYCIALVMTIALIAFLEILNAIYYKKGFWVDLLGVDNVGKVDSWCEAVDADKYRFIMEPANARSDYFFLLIGAVIFSFGVQDYYMGNNCIDPDTKNVRDDERSFMQKDEEAIQVANEGSERQVKNCILLFPQISIFNGVFNILHGLGSFFYHSCQCSTWFGGRADGAGMLAVISFPMLYTMVQLFCSFENTEMHEKSRKDIALSWLPPLGQFTLWILAIVGMIDSSPAFESINAISFISIMGTWLYFKRWYNHKNKSKRYLKIWMIFLSLAVFAIAFGVWSLDMEKIWCPNGPRYVSWFNGHSLWHFLCAVCLLFIYMFYRLEVIIVTSSAD